MTKGGSGIGVGVIGSGISGILMGILLKQAGVDDFVIYEKSDDVGGTWHLNTYPGLHCDVPSHLYSYSFAPNPNWTLPFAGQPEIKAYLRACAEKFGLMEHIRFDTRVDTARYVPETGSWALETKDGGKADHRILVSATGILTEPNMPEIEDLDRFEGLSWHSGDWRHDVDLGGRRVAVVGSAASGVQVVPETAKMAGQVFLFQRTPNWIVPRENIPYTDAEKKAFADDRTGARKRLMRDVYRVSLDLYKVFRKDPQAAHALRMTVLDHMKKAVSDPRLIALLTPKYEPGCKRLLVSDDFYPALVKDHVHLIPEGVERLTRTGVVATGGRETDVDIVIFCTGYRIGDRRDGRPATDIIGRNGVSLPAAMSLDAFHGVVAPGFPNYFSLNGANGPASYSSLFHSAEVQGDYIVRCIREIEDKNIRALEIRSDVTRAYNKIIQAELQNMSWSGDCPNFYLDAEGKHVLFYPGTVGRMRRELRAVTLDDYVVDAF